MKLFVYARPTARPSRDAARKPKQSRPGSAGPGPSCTERRNAKNLICWAAQPVRARSFPSLMLWPVMFPERIQFKCIIIGRVCINVSADICPPASDDFAQMKQSDVKLFDG